MPVANAPIFARTFLGLQEELIKRSAGNGTHHIPIVIVCNSVRCKNSHTKENDRRVLICDEFRCWDCFCELVRNQKIAFGVSDKATDAEIFGLLEPYRSPDPNAKPFANNLFQLKVTPRFVAI